MKIHEDSSGGILFLVNHGYQPVHGLQEGVELLLLLDHFLGFTVNIDAIYLDGAAIDAVPNHIIVAEAISTLLSDLDVLEALGAEAVGTDLA